MAIEALNRDQSILPVTAAAKTAALGESPVASQGQPLQAPDALSAGAVTDAVATLQSALNSGPNPQFDLDYLSGLSVVTVRSKVSGEVVFQLPDRRAVELARLVKQGDSAASLGLLDITA